MQNQSPPSPARALFEELRQNEDAGTLDNWSASRVADSQSPVDDAPASTTGAFLAPDVIPELTPELASRRSAATNYGDLAAIIRLQSTEIERLALENDRLAARMDAVHQRQETEQNQRRDLEQRLREANARNETPAPAFDVEEVRRAAREGMSAEIKPVLVAILDLLESTLSRAAEVVIPAKPQAEAEAEKAVAEVEALVPARVPIDPIAEVSGEFHRLPDILTRPLEELTGRSRKSGPAPDPVVEPPAAAPLEPRVWARLPYYEAQPRAIPAIVPWTNLFS